MVAIARHCAGIFRSVAVRAMFHAWTAAPV
ncbi:hypothetical protein AFNJKBDN_CDS0060 [Halorubrum virus V_ICIS4]|nr:hypothetical protein AFNJKBDN_CDS0060 [Halorubrum virus V_ICIS4]